MPYWRGPRAPPRRYDDKGEEYYRNDQVDGYELYMRRASNASSAVSSVHDTNNSHGSRRTLRRDYPEVNDAFDRNVRERKHENHAIKYVELRGTPHPSGSAPWQGNVMAARMYDHGHNYMGAFHQDSHTGVPTMNRYYQEQAAANQQYRREEQDRLAANRVHRTHMSNAPTFDMRGSYEPSYDTGYGPSASGSSWANIAGGPGHFSSGMSYASAARPPPGYY